MVWKAQVQCMNITRNSELDKANARDSLSIKKFVSLAFDLQMSFVKQGFACDMATRDHPISGFSRILNKDFAADAEFLVLSLMPVKRRSSI